MYRIQGQNNPFLRQLLDHFLRHMDLALLAVVVMPAGEGNAEFGAEQSHQGIERLLRGVLFLDCTAQRLPINLAPFPRSHLDELCAPCIEPIAQRCVVDTLQQSVVVRRTRNAVLKAQQCHKGGAVALHEGCTVIDAGTAAHTTHDGHHKYGAQWETHALTPAVVGNLL